MKKLLAGLKSIWVVLGGSSIVSALFLLWLKNGGPKSIKDHLATQASIPFWGIYLTSILFLVLLIATCIFVFRQIKVPDYAKNFTSGEISGVKWSWEWAKINKKYDVVYDTLTPLCPHCERVLPYDSFKVDGRVIDSVFRCKRCDFHRSFKNQSEPDVRNSIIMEIRHKAKKALYKNK